MASDDKKPRGWNADPAIAAIPDRARPTFDPYHRDAEAKRAEALKKVDALKAQYGPAKKGA